MRSSTTPLSRRAKQLAVPVLAVAAAIALVGCSSSSSTPSTAAATGAVDQSLHELLPASIQSSGVITMGALWETPPVISVDVNNADVPVGIAPDLAALLGAKLGVDVTWSNMQWPAQLPGVQAGTIDALFGQVSITAEREQSVVDLVPFQQSTESLLLPADNPHKVAKIADMCGLTIAVPVGSNQSAQAKAVSDASCGSKPITLAEYPGATGAVQALRAGTVDAWFDTTSAIDALVASDSATYTSAVIPESEVPTSFTGIAVSKSQPGLTEALAGAMKAIIEDGSYAAVYDKYEVPSQAITVDQVVVNPMTGTAPGAVSSSSPTPAS
ncbi:transporter substrate-binding domain-containing protein [Herbiconiux sp. 11R-BC]|uniref:transporter substrate-binding domain-containing protein n=1 Tax=Herbiconiux sp. 11R-BC TaxID=3111637 RepID=UPI0010F6A3CB